MTLLQSKDGIQYFTFEHSRDYQQVQFKFLDAVESMDPNNIVVRKQFTPSLPLTETKNIHILWPKSDKTKSYNLPETLG